MTKLFRIDVARTADVPDLAEYCATHGLRQAAPAGLSCVEVGVTAWASSTSSRPSRTGSRPVGSRSFPCA
jgi:hypothetical protein